MSEVEKLYPEIIRQQQSSPYRFEKIEKAGAEFKAYSPVCGDQFTFYPVVANGVIHDIHFYGMGCAISKAAASLLTKLAHGQTVSAIVTLCENYLAFLDQKKSAEGVHLPDELKAFGAVHQYPERYDCAALAWIEMRKFLLKQQS